MLQDIRLATRRLARTPLFTIVAVATLAIGIGANTSVFSLINAVRLRPLPFAASEQLMDLSEVNPRELCAGCSVGTSYQNYLDWRVQARSFSSVAAYHEDWVALGLADRTEQRRASRVSADLFPLLGTAPIRGRVFTAADDHPGAAHVAVIGEDMWRTHFNRDSNVVGATIRIDGESYQIVGVMPAQFAFPQFAELWIPLAPSAAASARDDRSIGVVARLADGVTQAAASAEMAAISHRLESEHAAQQKGWSASVTPLHSDLAGDYLGTATYLLAAVACVLVITCANLANLMLARATSRRAEFAVRAALGAKRSHLARQILAESMIVAFVGGATGLLLTNWGIEALRSYASEGLPRWINYDMDWRVLAFTLGASALTGLAFGAFAARYAASNDLNDALKDGGRGVAGGRSRTRDVLVVAQIAIALVLVIGAGLLTKAMLSGRSADMGYNVDGLVRADIGLTGHRYEDPNALRLFSDRVLDEVQHANGVRAVALSGLYIMDWPGVPHQSVAIDGLSEEQSATALHHVYPVSPGYFDALGVTVETGRGFTSTDVPGSTPVALVNHTLAGQLWPGAAAVGHHIRIGDVSWTVVGVAPDIRASPLARGAPPLMYLPLAQHPETQPAGTPLTLHVRMSPGSASATPAIQSAVRRVDPDVTTNNVLSVAESLRRWRQPFEAMAMLAAALGLFASLLAALGIYGVVAYFVGQRTHEIGVRMALGASPLDIVGLVLRRGMVLSAIGVGIGALGALAVTRLLSFMLFGISPSDPVVFASVAVGFVFVSLLAAYLPARRATRIDPLAALRAD